MALAKKTREVSAELLRNEEGGRQRWFSGPEGIDLFIYYQGLRRIICIELTFQNRLLSWEKQEGIRTARLQTWGPETTYRHDKSRIVFDNTIDSDTREIGLQLVQAMKIPYYLKHLCKKRFSGEK
jgi:hypothetical protein